MLKMPLAHINEITKGIVPSKRWDGKEKISAWQTRSKEKLNELLGLPLSKCKDNFVIEYKKNIGNIIETRFVFQSEEGFFVPCYFWEPVNKSGPLPLVICLQGHTTGMHVSMGRLKYPKELEFLSRLHGFKNKHVNDDFLSVIGADAAVRAVNEGCCALIMEQRCFGELGGSKKGPDCTVASLASILIGRTMIGQRVWDLQRALDVTEKNFEYDKNKVICIGNSGGGTTTFFASCLEERITHSVPSCYFCSFDDCIGALQHCACNYIPNIRRYFDMGDLAGLIIPRPLVIVAGKEDDIFPYSGVIKAFKEAERMYEGAGVKDQIRLVTGDGGHMFYPDRAWEVINSYLCR